MAKEILLLPGLMGSRLKKKEEKLTVWPNASIVNSYKDLVYPENNLDAHDSLWLYYRRIENYLERNGLKVTTFPYDWRASNPSHLEILKGELENLGDDVYIVAHSMGGILARLFINQYSEDEVIKKIKKIITLGTPWNGAPFAYKAIKYGVNIPELIPILLTTVTSKAVAPSFPSLYQLLPNEQYHQRTIQFNKPHFYESNGVPVTDWNDIESDLFVPLINAGLGGEPYGQIVLEFQELLHRQMNVEHHEIIGYGKKTIYTIKDFSVNEPGLEFDNGDGTVPIISAVSETPNKYFVNTTHNKLPKNYGIMNLVLNIVNDLADPVPDDVSIKRSFDEVRDVAFSGFIVKIGCPVTVSITNQNGDIVYGNIEVVDDEDFEDLFDDIYEVSTIGNTTYIFIPSAASTTEQANTPKVIVEAFDEGPTSIAIQSYLNGTTSNIGTFETININPKISLELNLAKSLEEVSLIVKETDKDDVPMRPDVVSVEKVEELVLPEVEFSVSAEKIIPTQLEGSLIVSGKVTFIVNDIFKGTYPISGLYYSVNNSDHRLIKAEVEQLLELSPGRNELEVLAVDSMGSTGEKKRLIIYNIERVEPEISLEFFHHQYNVIVKDNNEILYETLGIARPRFNVNIDDEENVFVRYDVINRLHELEIMYRDRERVMSLSYQDVFGETHKYNPTINENAIRAVLEGGGDDKNLNEFLNELGITAPYDYIILHKHEGKGAFRKITKETIQKSKHIFVEKGNISVDVYKSSDYLVSFHDFTQDIQVQKEESYLFKFKVINLLSKREVTDLQLTALVKTTFNDDDFISKEEIKISFDEKSNLYFGQFNVVELREFLSEYWTPQLLHSVDLVIQVKGNYTKELTTEEITIR
ncbi:lipase/acyltransferase domain-containing protein [Paenibacillus glycanilyticus]|uniref:Alpha/beta hydrolase n=1 Tax=Paenibacillus glycanilyticus TaxID=126569 RepID=A0ABQ6GDA9_9BACL|nr:alpha/beta hydrolase [Paenibacillus glycanilyticus]GLX67248.1 hypothetical protein MU1_15930 [Paenibacillus glycanilyticus]